VKRFIVLAIFLSLILGNGCTKKNKNSGEIGKPGQPKPTIILQPDPDNTDQETTEDFDLDLKTTA